MSGWLRRGRSERRARRADASGGPVLDGPPLATAGAGVAGYRIVRRIGAGERAEVFLATARRAEPPTDARGSAGPADGRTPPAPPAESPLVVLRIYRERVDDRSIALELDAMHVAGDAGMPALLDVAMTGEGARVAVVERIGGVGVAQLIRERSLEPGEAVTLVAPVVAGVSRLAAAGFVHTRLSPGDVQLDSIGRPRLLGLGALRRLPTDDPGAAHALRRESLTVLTEYVEQVAAAVRPSGVFDGPIALARAALEARPFVPFEAELERAVFGAASPAPVSGLPPAREPRLPARVLAPITAEPVAHQAAHPDARPRRRSGVVGGLLELAELPPPVLGQLAESADVDRLGAMGRRASAWFSGRRRPLVVAALIGSAALVLLLTAVPSADGAGVGSTGGAGVPDAASVGSAPDEGDTDDASQSAHGSSEDSSHEADAKAAPDGDGNGDGDGADGAPGGAGPDDAVAAARELLLAREACFADLDPACLASYVQAGSPLADADWERVLAARDGGAGIRPLDVGRIELVTEMGAAVLVRVAGLDDAEPASLLMVRNEAGWRLREIFD
ncbi:hypothetical protein [Agromyces sp. NPDC058110]|uniref:hypothetical protein n=1 Tax=Agromyces sp. NPDC058110 TaxID=3346345 RepID=UPI0036DC2197